MLPGIIAFCPFYLGFLWSISFFLYYGPLDWIGLDWIGLSKFNVPLDSFLGHFGDGAVLWSMLHDLYNRK